MSNPVLTAAMSSLGYRLFRVCDVPTELLIDPDVERVRSEMYSPLLYKHGIVLGRNEFPFGTYEADDSYSRCFDVAAELAFRHGLIYFEGFLMSNTTSGMIPVGHGWCTTRDGRIVDPTHSKYQAHPSFSYVGVPIRKEYIQWWKQVTGYYGCLDGDKNDRPIGVYYDHVSVWRDHIHA